MLLIAALVVVGGGVGLFFLLRGGGAEDAAETYVQSIFDGDCAQAWALISPLAQEEQFDGSQGDFCRFNQIPPDADDPTVTGSTVLSEGPPTSVEVSVTGVPLVTSVTLTMIEVDGDWRVDNVGDEGGREGQVPDLPQPPSGIPSNPLPEPPDIPTAESPTDLRSTG